MSVYSENPYKFLSNVTTPKELTGLGHSIPSKITHTITSHRVYVSCHREKPSIINSMCYGKGMKCIEFLKGNKRIMISARVYEIRQPNLTGMTQPKE